MAVSRFPGPAVGSQNSLTLAQLAKALAAINYGVPGSNGFLASQVAASQQLSSSAYGMWAILDTTSAGRIGAFGIGDRTPVASVPTTGTATYTGTMIGAGSGSAAQVAVCAWIDQISRPRSSDGQYSGRVIASRADPHSYD